jgi:hypothetical protein
MPIRLKEEALRWQARGMNLAGTAAVLLHQGLEHRVGRVFVELDADFGPKLIGQVVELAAGRNRN